MLLQSVQSWLAVGVSHSVAERKTRGVGTSRGAWSRHRETRAEEAVKRVCREGMARTAGAERQLTRGDGCRTRNRLTEDDECRERDEEVKSPKELRTEAQWGRRHQREK